MNGRLLVFNCHEAWVHQLRYLDHPLDIIVGLPGRHMRDWDTAIRPAPPNSRFVTLPQVLTNREAYDCIIAHNLTDLLDAKTLPGPRILMIHLTLDGMILEQKSRTSASDFREAVRRFVAQTRTQVAAVSELKGRSWSFADEEIVSLTADPADYFEWKGDLARGLRVSNFISRRPQTLLWEFHQRAFSDIPVTLVGHNPEIPGVQPSRDWTDLKQILSRHRFFIHTAAQHLEDGYNTATLEAMAAGLPVLGNLHPTSPIEHGVNGFLSDDPAELNRYARILLNDRALAAKMGQAARATVTARFSHTQFRAAMWRSIDLAQQKHVPSIHLCV